MGPIGVFDSGYGGLSVLRRIAAQLPQYDYLYIGDNARAPYGTRSWDCVYEFTLQAVRYLFNQGCPLVILACNTASAKALRTIQQRDLPAMADPTKRVLGVIRPTAEAVGSISRNGHVGIVCTPGTASSGSYDIEIKKLNPTFATHAQGCPMWVPIIENMEINTEGARFFVQRDINQLLNQDGDIDTIILGCTHYPLLYNVIRESTPPHVQIVEQGSIVAASLADYLHRHPEMEHRLQKGGNIHYLTTESPDKFAEMATIFMGRHVQAERVTIA